MNNNKVTADRKKNKTAAKKLALIMIPSVILGAIIGVLAAFFEDFMADVDLTEFWEAFNNISFFAVPVVFLAVLIVVTALCLTYNKKAKSIAEKWNGEDEETINKAEKFLSLSSSISSVGSIFMYFLFGVWAHFLPHVLAEENPAALIISGVFLLFFLASIIVYALISRTTVEVIKNINPEKKGEVLDFKFAKEWENSCDEAERLSLYKAGFSAFKAANYLCVALWVLSVFGEMFFEIGITPLLFVTAIWLTLTLTYLITAYKLENKTKHKGEKNE